MSRPGYTQLAPTDLRRDQFERLARVLGLDPEQHLDRVKMLDFGMICAIAMVSKENDVKELMAQIQT